MEETNGTDQRRARQITQISLRNLWQPEEYNGHAQGSSSHSGRPALLSRPSKRRPRRSSDPPALKRTTSKGSIRSLDSKVTTRERASSSVSFINARAHQECPRSSSQQSERPDAKGKGKLELHTPRNEQAANAERWSREATLRKSMIRCRCVVSDSSGVVYVSEELGPAMDFDWQIPVGSLGSAEEVVKVDIWGLRAAEKEKEWKLMRSWSISLNSLVSLGHKPSAFPALVSNTIIFQLQGEEYFSTSLNLPEEASLSDAEEEDEGTLSDPGPSQSSIKSKRKTRFLKAVEQGRKDQEEMLERSRRETRMLVCESLEQMVAVLDIAQAISKGHMETEESRADLDERMKRSHGGLHREVKQMKHAVCVARDQSSTAQDQISHVKKAIEQQQARLSRRRGRLKDSHALLDTLWSELDGQREANHKQEKKLATLLQHTARTQASIASTLDFIFPIIPSAKHYDSMTFSILGLDLPNSVFPPKSSDDELVSSALGLVAQLLNMLAAYLGVPLHYALTCAGSRSLVTDLISMIKGPRVFPLYSQGVERYRFEYAVFLLNKDIEQVMQFQKIAMPDLRDTLPNIKNLMLTVISRPTTAHLPNGTPDFSASNGLMHHLEDALKSVADHSDDDEDASPTSSRSSSPAPTLRASVRSRSSTTTVKINADKLANSTNTGLLQKV